jgi:hypothetical protein
VERSNERVELIVPVNTFSVQTDSSILPGRVEDAAMQAAARVRDV